MTPSVLVTIADCGTTVQFTVTGPTIRVIECGGCPVEQIFLGKLDSAKADTMDQDFIRDLWVSGYDGDPDANGLMVEVEYSLVLLPDHCAEAAEQGAEWGQQEALHQLEAVENGHQRTTSKWTTGMWCGSNPFSRKIKNAETTQGQRDYSDLANEYEGILDRAAQAAYEAAIDAAREVKA